MSTDTQGAPSGAPNPFSQPDPQKPDRFWSWTTTRIEIVGAGGTVARVYGFFIYAIHSPPGADDPDDVETLDPFSLTEEEVCLVIPAPLLGKPAKDVCCADVSAILEHIFGELPFHRVPPAPTDTHLSITQMAPSKRASLMAKLGVTTK